VALATQQGSFVTLRVLDQGKHHVVVDKAANMVVVAGRGAPKPTLLDLVQQQFGKAIRPVHRLDRVTTGCCIFAKSLYGQQALSNAFRRHLVEKRYLAIVEGSPKFTTLNIDARLQRVDDPDARKGPLAHQTIEEEGQRALTRVKVLSKTEDFALVEALPRTGRMHQIRAHLAHVGHPILGDFQYGAKNKYAPHSIALHAAVIIFPAPDGGKKTVKAPVPSFFQETLTKLGLTLPLS
jgi:RluA family pseudouridine synthase